MTIEFHSSTVARMCRDPEFAIAIAEEATNALRNGENFIALKLFKDIVAALESQSANPMNVVIVCGSRHYTNTDYVFDQLDRIHAEEPITRLAHGRATGADTIADAWAKSRGVPVQPYPATKAEWNSLGRKAGPMRNRKMLMCERPQKVIAFPGNDGTANMIRIAEQDHVKIIDLRMEP